MEWRIAGVDGPAARAGIKPGDRLVSIDGEPVLDFVDFNWFSAQDRLTIETQTDQGTVVRHIAKEPEEPIGIEIDGLYPDERRCANRCRFCFVDQMPLDMRESLYVKDDDWRYSVLFGNYITLTNVSDREFERILRRAPSPLYVSVHATDPEVRVQLMGNKRAGEILPQLKRLAGAGIALHCQIVLVPGYNDGAALTRSLEDLYGLYPGVRTVAVVPVGLTNHRLGLAELMPVGRQEALAAVQAVGHLAERSLREHGERFAYASDEMIERAGLPPMRYDDGGHTPQLANGVGMVSDLLDELEWELDDLPDCLPSHRHVTIATGVSAAGLMGSIAQMLEQRVRNLHVDVLRVENRLFGPEVTVAGLICGGDIEAAAQGKTLGQELLVPQAALRSGEDVFLDDMTLEELGRRIGTPARAVACDGAALARAVCGLEDDIG